MRAIGFRNLVQHRLTHTRGTPYTSSTNPSAATGKCQVSLRSSQGAAKGVPERVSRMGDHAGLLVAIRNCTDLPGIAREGTRLHSGRPCDARGVPG